MMHDLLVFVQGYTDLHIIMLIVFACLGAKTDFINMNLKKKNNSLRAETQNSTLSRSWMRDIHKYTRT